MNPRQHRMLGKFISHRRLPHDAMGTPMMPFCIAILLMLTASCSPIKQYRQLNVIEGERTATVGTVMFRLSISEDLPNAFGRADLFGGKVDKGYAEVRLLKIENDTRILLGIVEQYVDSTETTMDRYSPTTRVEQNVSITAGSPYINRVSIDLNIQRDILVADVKITILEIRPYSVLYRVSDTRPN